MLAGAGFALWKYAYSVTDYSKKHKDFFDYTFDGDYTIELVANFNGKCSLTVYEENSDKNRVLYKKITLMAR